MGEPLIVLTFGYRAWVVLLRPAPGAIAWQAAGDESLANAVAKLLNRARFKESTTTRNRRTPHKILAVDP